MRALKSILLATVTYLFVACVALAVVRALRPADFDDQARLLGGPSLLAGLAVQALSCFCAGIAASGRASVRPRTAMLTAGGGLLAVNAALAAACWSAAPAWYDWATLAMTAPFAALGVAWRRAGDLGAAGGAA
jgi:hypothetical protein